MIVVIGGGPAGRMASMRLAAAGREVTLVDHRRSGLGGQCLHHGCMVINAHNDVATSISRMQELASLGVIDQVPKVSYTALSSRMQEIQALIANILDTETKNAGVKVLCGSASVDGNQVFIDEKEIKAEAVIIATGSVPSVPPIPGTDISGVYTPHTITTMNYLPDHITIIGSGVIAAEYAYALNELGAQVVMVARSVLLRKMPEEEREEIKKDLEHVIIMEGTEVTGILGEKSVTGIRIVRDGREEVISTRCVLLATGLIPNTSMISGIPLDNTGAIAVDESMQTGVSGIYAAGDVTGPPYLTPVARRQGIIAADAILGRDIGTIPPAIPQVIRLRHEHGFVSVPGERSRAVTIPTPAGPGTFWSVPSRKTGKALMEIDEKNQICRIYEASFGAGAVAAYFALLMNEKVTLKDISDCIEVHPSADGLIWIARYLADQME